MIFPVNNRSANNNQTTPEVREEWLENQLVFGKPKKTHRSVRYSKSHSFDEHLLPNSDKPAVLYVASTTTHQKSLSNSYETKCQDQEAPQQNTRSSSEISNKISKQSIKQLQAWNKVGTCTFFQ